MKRILALLLVLAMCVSLFAGCRNNTPDATTEPTQTTTGEAQPDQQLEKAIEYLRAFYKKAAEKTPMDYTRLGTVRIGTTSYDVVWSVDVDEEVLKVVKNADGSYTIDINEEAIKESTEPTPYVLTATITGKDGRVLTLTWNHIIPAAIDEDAIDIIKKAYALAPGETLEGTHTLTGVIITVDTMYDPNYKNITVTIEVAGAEDMPIKCYRLKGEGADKLAVGDTITVTGSLTNYNGEIEFAAGCILEAVESGGGEVPVAPENPLDILKEAYSLAPGKSLPYPCTLTGTITSVDYAYDPNYENVTVTMNSHGYSIKCYRMKGAGADQLNVNDIITVYGVITNYNGTIEFGAGCTLVDLVNQEPPAAIPDPTPGTQLSIADAIAIGKGKEHNTYTEGKYYITGKIVSIDNTTYGNMYVSDGTGTLLIYGTWSEDGNTRYDKLVPLPAVGDTVTLYGIIGRYGSNPQMKNAWIIGAKGESPVIPDAPSVDVATELVAGTPYRFGMAQGNLDNAVYYLAGGMSGYYMATTADPAAAINVYVEETAGGYYFYTMNGEEKLYINMVVSADGLHVNGAYEATASTVYTYNAEKNTLIAVVNDAEYWFGTRNDKTFTTMGPCAVEYAGFFGQFYVGSEEDPVPPEQPDEPEQPTAGLEEGVAYTISADNANGTLWFNGTISGGRFNGSYEKSEAVSVYAENVTDGFLLYFMDGETKQYICIADTSSGGSFSTDAASATVFEWNAEKATAAVAEDSNNRGFGVGATSTFNNFSPYDLAGTYNWGQFIAVDGGNTDPEQPTCEHTNTKVEGAKEATCTTNGHTGKTVCADCGKTLSEGEVITAPGHNFVNGTCGVCGEAEPSNPDVPTEPTYVTSIAPGTAYKLGLYSTNKSATYYFTGVMSGYYGATETAYEKGVDVFVEETTDGYYLYFIDASGAKQYINLVASGTYKNFTFAATASSVYTWDAEKNALYTTVGTEVCYIGTYGTYVTMGVLQTSKLKDTDYIARLYTMGGSSEPEQPTCQHTETKVEGNKAATCTEDGHTGKTVCVACGEIISEGEVIPATGHSFADGTCGVCGEADPDYTPDVPAEPTYVTSITAGTAYKLGLYSTNKSATYYFTGVMSGYYGATETAYEKGIDVFVEEANGGYYLYFIDASGAKQYINLVASGTYKNFTFAATASSVYTWDAEKNALYTAIGSEICYIGTYGTYVTMGVLQTSKLKDTDYIARLYTMGGTSEPEQPTCQHTNTTVVGTVEATCTENGHTGKTMCADCGETLNEGSVITAPGHSYENGTCGICGEADPDAQPEATAGGKADFNDIVLPSNKATGDSSYTATYTSPNGWVTNNCAIQCGGTTDMNPQFTVIGPDTTHKAPCLNGGKTVGSITSPTLTGGISKLTMKYTKIFTDKKLAVTITITDVTTGNKYTHVVERDVANDAKYTVWDAEWILETPVTGDFTIEVVNNCPSGGSTTKNQDRFTILELAWEAPAIPEEPAEETVTYVVADYEFATTVGEIVDFKLDDTLTFNAAKAKLYTTGDVPELAVYGKQPIVLESTKTISKIVLLARYKDSTIHVETSTDGTNWVYDCDVPYTQAESEVEIALNNPAKYVRLIHQDSMRFKTMTVTYSETAAAPEEPSYEHVFGTDTGYAVSLSEDGTSLNCYQLGSEEIYYKTYFAEKPEQGNFEVREYNGKIYYASISSWGPIPFESHTISGNILQLNPYVYEEAVGTVIELELISENQYTVISGTDSVPEGMVFEFGADVCAIMGHCASQQCEDDVLCNTCEKFICAGFGHEFGEGTICFRCFAAEKPEEPGEASSATYTMSAYKVDGELGGGEASRDLDENVKFTISAGWFTTEARIYKNANGVIESKKAISSLVVNAGYKTSTFVVYTSEDGATWTEHSTQSYVSGYGDVTIGFETPVKYIKLDAPNAQLRIKTITVNFA